MQIERNEDGTFTVRIPKAPEAYDPADGILYIEETVSADALKAALTSSRRKPAAEEPEA